MDGAREEAVSKLVSLGGRCGSELFHAYGIKPALRFIFC